MRASRSSLGHESRSKLSCGPLVVYDSYVSNSKFLDLCSIVYGIYLVCFQHRPAHALMQQVLEYVWSKLLVYLVVRQQRR